jgi:hypothetical protein
VERRECEPKIRFCGAKNWLMLQPLVGQLPTGVPSVDVSTFCAPADSDEGTFVRLKNQILHEVIQPTSRPQKKRTAYEMPELANSVTHTPPPPAASGAP